MVPGIAVTAPIASLRRKFASLLAVLLAFAFPACAAEDPWLLPGPDGKPQVRLYFFWSLTCPHCETARPFVETIPMRRPWVALHSLELSRHPENAVMYRDLVRSIGQDAGERVVAQILDEEEAGRDILAVDLRRAVTQILQDARNREIGPHVFLGGRRIHENRAAAAIGNAFVAAEGGVAGELGAARPAPMLRFQEFLDRAVPFSHATPPSVRPRSRSR